MLIFENKMNYPKTWEPGERKEMQGKMTNNSRAKAKSTFIHLISVIRIHISFGTKKKIPEKMSDTKLRWNAEFEFLSVPTLCAHELIFKHECAISFFFWFWNEAANPQTACYSPFARLSLFLCMWHMCKMMRKNMWIRNWIVFSYVH